MSNKLHPLLTKGENKQHLVSGKNNIFEAEKELTVTEMRGACMFNIFKYQHREKGQDESDNEKVEKYNDYLDELNFIPKRLKDTSVRRAWKNLNKEWDYNA